MGYINEVSLKPINTMYPIISNTTKSISLFFNCKQASIDDVLRKPIAKDYAEISFA
jgi:hypothetical protein